MFKKIRTTLHNRTTYRLGLLQDKAYRVMKREMSAQLAPHDMSTTEWALLGLLHDERVQYPTEAAEELGVEGALVTVLLRKLKQQGFAEEKKDNIDSRRKCIFITDAGRAFVDTIEKEMRARMRPLIHGATPRALAEYISILDHVVKNGQKK